MVDSTDPRWEAMLRRSFSPTQWFVSDERPIPLEDDQFSQVEERKMYVYRPVGNGLWIVGHYAPDGEWFTESEHSTRDEAARRVRWLHGGG